MPGVQSKRRGLDVRELFVLLFLAAIFAMSVRPTLDPDMWWHLETGQIILESGIPRHDIFSYTVPDHEWITHEWLSEVIMWLGWAVAGLPGLIILFAAANTLTFWLIYRRCQGRPYLAAFVVLLAAIASSVVWGARPQMFNLLFTAAYIYLIEGVRQQTLSKRALWWLPLLSMLWANLHSGYLLGIVLLGTYAVGDFLGQWRKQDEAPSYDIVARLVGITALSFLTAAINPNGPALWIYPFYTLGSQAMQSYIQEWHSPDFHQDIYWAFAGLFFLGVLAWSLSPRRPTITELLLFLGTLAAGLQSSRNIPIFALVAAPIICRHLALTLEGAPGLVPLLQPATARRSWLNGLVAFLGLLAVVLWSWQTIQTNPEEIRERYPLAAVDYIEQSGLAEQNVYNSYNWGGYLIWRDIPVFVDGRADVYGDEFLFYYRQTFDPQPTWQEPLDEFAVDYVLMERNDPLTTLLAASSGWEQAYSDDVAMIFVRRDE